MKRIQLIRFLVICLLLLPVVLMFASCNGGEGGNDTGSTAPDTIETVAPDDSGTDTGNGEETTEAEETEAPEFSVQFPVSELPDYAKYATASRIKEVLGNRKTIAIAAGGKKYYSNGELKLGGLNLITQNDDGSITLNPSKMGPFFGLGTSDLQGTTPEEIAAEVGMGVAVFDGKLVLFYEGEAPIHTYDDLYTYEAMYLYMTNADESEIVNAFIDLPSRISNDTNNTIF